MYIHLQWIPLADQLRREGGRESVGGRKGGGRVPEGEREGGRRGGRERGRRVSWVYMSIVNKCVLLVGSGYKY